MSLREGRIIAIHHNAFCSVFVSMAPLHTDFVWVGLLHDWHIALGGIHSALVLEEHFSHFFKTSIPVSLDFFLALLVAVESQRDGLKNDQTKHIKL